MVYLSPIADQYAKNNYNYDGIWVDVILISFQVNLY